MTLALAIFLAGFTTYYAACKIHKMTMPLWYALSCYYFWGIALQLDHWYLRFGLISLLSVIAFFIEYRYQKHIT